LTGLISGLTKTTAPSNAAPALPGRSTVSEINPVNQQVRVWAEVENRQMLLRPGLRGNLTIHPEPAQTAKRENQ